MRVSLVLLVIALLLPAGAHANPADLFGLGAPSMSRAGSGIATDSDACSVWRNPAGLGYSQFHQVSLGFHLGWAQYRCFDDPISRGPLLCPASTLTDGNRDGRIDPDDPDDRWVPDGDDYPAPHGGQLAVSIAIRKFLRIGVALSLPLERLLLIQTEDPYLPYYPRWKSRHQRPGVHLGASVRIVDGLYVGIGASILARARLNLHFTVEARASDEDLNQEGEGDLAVDFVVNPDDIRVDVRPTIAPIAGVAWDLGTLSKTLQGVRLGVVYRHPVNLRVDPAVVSLDMYGVVDDVGSFGDVLVPLQAQVLFSYLEWFTPRQVAVGIGVDRPRFQTAVDVTWHQWSALVPSVAVVDGEGTDIDIGLVGLDPQVRNARPFTPDFRDTVSVAAGGELRPKRKVLTGKVGSLFREIGVIFRLGYGYESSFVREQSALTNFLDNPTHRITAGLGLTTFNPFDFTEGPVDIDLFVQAHVLQRRTHTKEAVWREDGIPAGWPERGVVDSGGLVLVGGGAISLGF